MLAALREAHLKALNDPDLRREARELSLPIDPIIGDAVAAKIRVALTQTPESIALLRQATTIP
jgi:hypothetical protein